LPTSQRLLAAEAIPTAAVTTPQRNVVMASAPPCCQATPVAMSHAPMSTLKIRAVIGFPLIAT